MCMECCHVLCHPCIYFLKVVFTPIVKGNDQLQKYSLQKNYENNKECFCSLILTSASFFFNSFSCFLGPTYLHPSVSCQLRVVSGGYPSLHNRAGEGEVTGRYQPYPGTRGDIKYTQNTHDPYGSLDWQRSSVHYSAAKLADEVQNHGL